MADILRTWACLNARCASSFDAWDANPACPACGCVRVSWVPGGGHIRTGAAKTGDSELRALADIFKMGDMHSAERGRGAKIVKSATPVTSPSGPAIQFAPGFSAAVDPGRAVCVPSSTGVDYKARPTIGAALPPNRSVPGIGSNTRVEATHRAAKQ